MNSFDEISELQYDMFSRNMDDSESSRVLEIYVHHARNIHNICIYENQDVYAKFSLTYNPDQTLSTRVVQGGGKNPDFNENLRMKISQFDSVLKCEIWMLSKARTYLEDQLLGFALVPLSQVLGKGKVTENYSLSSTDLFHSPAGTVRLSLSLDKSLPVDESNSISDVPVCSSISSEVMLLDPAEYSRIEFPDVNVVMENKQMVSEYFDLAKNSSCSRPGIATFLRLGVSPPQPAYDFEMTANSSKEHPAGSVSPNNSSIQNSSFLSSTTTSLSDDRNSADSVEKKARFSGALLNSVDTFVVTTEAGNRVPGPCPDTSISRKSGGAAEENESKISNKEDKINIKKEGNIPSVQYDRVLSAPLGNINLETEQSAMQQQIVDMYMKSMQPFTDSLANMKLPMDLNKPENEHRGVLIQNHDTKPETDQKKKDGSRVFYGSRAFF
ncbi:uncharacterized protein LOC111468089 isoform X2 [Cucurbita maxima]|uniref:Uncharacterized protein LOC111468089 isoform X2 n=1 Tax=Cucurbita maxima TaxID=3661 RepID=A0A6J1I129_CUCMA|nr:uncharacterized protein LOC111468089 isoform X2 [Cucurbita maxima]